MFVNGVSRETDFNDVNREYNVEKKEVHTTIP